MATVTCCVSLAIGIAVSFAAPPGWWANHGVIDTNQSANDFAAVNQGQLKNLATSAYLEMEINFSDGGAGDALDALINPNDPADAAIDIEGDGLTNHEEFTAGASPLLVDTDGDGLNDGYEVASNRNPAESDFQTSVPGPTGLRVHQPVRHSVGL